MLATAPAEDTTQRHRRKSISVVDIAGRGSAGNLYQETLRLRNIKLLSDQELSFTTSGKPRMWTVLLGDNGTCKTTIAFQHFAVL